MGALTIKLDEISPQHGEGRYKVSRGTITFSASYATGGDTFTLDDLKLTRLDSLFMEYTKDAVTHGDRVTFEPDYTARTVIAYDVSDAAEVTAAEDLSDVTVRFRAEGA